MNAPLLRPDDLRAPRTYDEALAFLHSRAPRNADALAECRELLGERSTPQEESPLPLGLLP